MTGFTSKRQAALDKVAQPEQEPTLQKKNRKRGSIALARSLCYQINGAADDSDDMDGGGYGSVDIAEILSAEVERLQAALAQPVQERELFLKAFNNAIYWQNLCVHLYEIIEMLCLDAEDKLKEVA